MNSDQSNSEHKSKSKKVTLTFDRRAGIVVSIIVSLLAAFWLGTLYGSHKNKSSSTFDTLREKAKTTSNTRWNGVGTVTEVSNSTITIKESVGGTRMAAITKSTEILDRKNKKISIDQIKKDQRVIVSANKDAKDANKLTATRIRVLQQL